MNELSGHGGPELPAMAAGTFGYRTSGDLLRLLRDAIDFGFNHFDTAPSYSNHDLLGDALSKVLSSSLARRDELFLIDKIDGWQMHETKGCVRQHVERALEKLNTDYIDLLLIHWPFPSYFLETWQTFVELRRLGIARNIGLCNVELRHLQYLLGNTSTKPQFVQIERHPLNQEQDVVNFCRQAEISIQAYSPVCRMIPNIVESRALGSIASTHGRSIGQVIMRWHLQSGVSPVFMTTKRDRLKEYRETYHFRLSDQEMSLIGEMNEDYKLFLGSRACPGF